MSKENVPDGRNIKALALDLDGTVLAPGAVLREKTRAFLRGCIERGIRLIICTGRSVDSTERFRREIGAEGPEVCFNGAEVVNMPGGEILGAFLLEREVADFCVDIARRENVYYQIYFPVDTGAEADGPEVDSDTVSRTSGPRHLLPGGPSEILKADRNREEADGYRIHTGVQAVFGDLKEDLSAPGFRGCIKSMFITSPEMIEKIRPEVEERFGNRIYITKTFPTFLEVMKAGVSKGAALQLAMDHLGLKKENVLACGDEENDLPMFSVAGFSAAPANAKEQVLNAAMFRFKSCAEEGLAEFLESVFS
jgi:hydroxymethylpyrimidine pyrophosphatase-like HAD family hydrolase